jgi:predicted nucleic acid-binding protein
MPVVSNTSPLNYLVLIGEIEILPALHHHVVIPVAVSEELHDPATPDAVRGWIENPPGWLEIRRPNTCQMNGSESSAGVKETRSF